MVATRRVKRNTECKRRRLVAVGLAVLGLVATSCSASVETAAPTATTSEDTTVTTAGGLKPDIAPSATFDLPEELPISPLSEFLDTIEEELSSEEITQIYAQETAECMQSQGFDYIEYVRPTPRIIDDPDGEAIEGDESSLEWAEKYGFGISTLAFAEDQLSGDLISSPSIRVERPPPNPNDLYYDSLSRSDQAAFDAAMHGTADTTGCWQQADNIASRRYDVQQTFYTQFRAQMNDIERRAANDVRVTTFQETLKACVRDKGHEYVGIDTVFAELQPRVDALMARLPPDPLDLVESETAQMTQDELEAHYNSSDGPSPLPAEFHDELRELQAEEVELAVAVNQCGSLRTLDDVRQLVRIELEEKFLAENEGLIVAFAEANRR